VANELKILILKPSSLGDVIHAVPVLRLLKAGLPQSRIYWWLDTGLMPLMDGDPDLSGIIPFPRSRWRNPGCLPEVYRSVCSMREHRFDVAIDLQGLARSAFFGWLSRPGILMGLDNPREGAREGARGFYDLFAPRSPQGTHAVDRYLAILPLLKIPVHSHFEWLPKRMDAANAVQNKWRPGNAPWVMLLPGARWNNKRWPAQNFAEAVKQLAAREKDLRFAVLGGREDIPLGAEITRSCPSSRCLDLTGKTTLPEMVEWIRLSSLTLTNDTGPMHVAAAMKKPVVAVFGPTDPRSTGPYGQQANVLQAGGLPCIPCFKGICRLANPMACLHAISPDRVVERALQLLVNAPAKAGS
jgi:lipopolysaccharide heptosyltransferase I